MNETSIIPVYCLYPSANSTNVREATSNECRFARFAGTLLLLISLVSFIINIRSLINTRKTIRFSRRDIGLVIGMFVSSLCVIIISVPSVVLQCFLCRRLCIHIVCYMEGFNSFLNGCVAMYMLVALSIIRYSTTANSSMPIDIQRQLDQRNLYIVGMCFIFGGIWAIPPLFGRMSAYAPEGLGFHCGLDWLDRSLAGRIYFLFLFIGVFFIPISIVIYVNVYIQRTIYRLTHIKPCILLELSPNPNPNPNPNEVCIRRHVSDVFHTKEKQRLQRLHEDRRFVVATGISVIIYIVAWTPYSIVALAQVFGDRFSLYNPWLMTTCAFLAKLSMITNPIIYTMILKSHDTITHTR
ncbi:hypothetical protein I4U23_008639 [Adineta vaga]|nr:hypothetical protein I4U23_008639 [Adineta vaga]